MGSLATEVSLHCMICYEEFDLKEHVPVVLPCGHTYLCEVCAKRLKKCMECREPLFWTPPAPKVNPPGLGANARSPGAPLRYTGGSHRGRYLSAPQTPPHPSYAPPPVVKEEPIPLPLPKNTVLMDMIEAAERQARLLAEAKKEQERNDDDENDDEDDQLIEATLAGMSALAGACGTYAVREPLGLAVLPFDPNRQHQHLGKKEDLLEEKKSEDAREPFTIEDGQTVQVVTEEDGVYKLARGLGFIVASVNQLVKVGGPLNQSCRLEGMLDSVNQKQIKLQKELDEINLLADGLSNQIKLELEEVEEHPVISARKEPVIESDIKVNDENDAAALSKSPASPEKTYPNVDRDLTASPDSDEDDLGEHHPRTPARDHTIPNNGIYADSPAHSCPMPMTNSRNITADESLNQPFMDTPTAGLPRYRVNNDDDFNGLTSSLFGCGSALFGERLLEDASPALLVQDMDSVVLSLDNDDTMGARSQLAARPSAMAADDFHRGSHERSGSFDGINFRTGMSGHRGLNQVSKKKQSPMSNHRQVRLMSEHRGVAQTRTTNNGKPVNPARTHL